MHHDNAHTITVAGCATSTGSYACICLKIWTTRFHIRDKKSMLPKHPRFSYSHPCCSDPPLGQNGAISLLTLALHFLCELPGSAPMSFTGSYWTHVQWKNHIVSQTSLRGSSSCYLKWEQFRPAVGHTAPFQFPDWMNGTSSTSQLCICRAGVADAPKCAERPDTVNGPCAAESPAAGTHRGTLTGSCVPITEPFGNSGWVPCCAALPGAF